MKARARRGIRRFNESSLFGVRYGAWASAGVLAREGALRIAARCLSAGDNNLDVPATMNRIRVVSAAAAVGMLLLAVALSGRAPALFNRSGTRAAAARSLVTVTTAIAHDVSGSLNWSDSEPPSTSDFTAADRRAERARRVMAVEPNEDAREAAALEGPAIVVPAGSTDVEQTAFGSKPPATLVVSFDGLGVGFTGPQGTTNLRNPSDNTLAVGPNHIVQIVNTRMAIFTKKGTQYDTTGLVLYGPGETRNVFKGFGGGCEARNNGDAVVRYDQLADRWLIVMPIFARLPVRQDAPPPGKDGDPAARSVRGRPGQPGAATRLYVPPPPAPESVSAMARRPPGQRPPADSGVYAMCYAVSIGADPFGPYYRYEFVRPLYPDYPRPAVWPDGYYQRAPGMKSFRSTRASPIARACSRGRTQPNSAWSSMA